MEAYEVDLIGTITDVAGVAAETIISSFLSVLPIIIGVAALFWGVRYALGKLKVGKVKG